MSKLKDGIVDFLAKNDKPVKLEEIAKSVKGSVMEFKSAMKELIKDGKVSRLKSQKYCLAQNINLLTGYIDGHPDGYAFFIPEDESLEDLFIPPKKMNGAFHKDKVAVRIEYFRGKKEAGVVKILERGFKKVVGRIERSLHFAHVVPFVKKIFNDIYIPKKFSENLKDNDVVICEIISFPHGNKNPEGKILEVLGNLSDKGIENKIVMAKYDLNRDFPKSVTKEVKKDSLYLMGNPGERTDFTKLFTVTIDGETAKDFDDAISIERTQGDSFVLYVHIADVAHFVRPETFLDKEAYKRGTSVYFPEFAIPMLPEELSNNLCSLKPEEKRLTLTAKIFYNDKGERVKTEIYQSVIKSSYRLTYNYVSDLIDKKQKTRSKKLQEFVDNAVVLTSLLMGRRKIQGTIDFDLPEPEFFFDENGELFDIRPLERKLSHRIIEHFMIEANEAVSEFLEKRGNGSVYRIHGEPSLLKVREFLNILSTFGISMDLPEDITPKTIQHIAKQFEEKEYGHILSSLLVRTMEKAVYSTENIGHFGLASKSYTHFTSPIRRYPDLIVHRLIKKILFKYKFDADMEILNSASKQSSETEQRSTDAEREVHQYKKLKFLEKFGDKIYDAYINRVSSGGIFIFIPKLIMGGFIPISSLEDDFYSYNYEDSYIMGKKKRKTFKIGDSLKVTLLRVNYDYLEADFKCVF